MNERNLLIKKIRSDYGSISDLRLDDWIDIILEDRKHIVAPLLTIVEDKVLMTFPNHWKIIIATAIKDVLDRSGVKYEI